MSRESCPSPQEDCKYAPECFSDRDHLIPQRLGTTALKRIYLSLPHLSQQICRREHDERNARHDRGDTSDIPRFPSNEAMRNAILSSVEAGDIVLSKRQEKRLGL